MGRGFSAWLATLLGTAAAVVWLVGRDLADGSIARAVFLVGGVAAGALIGALIDACAILSVRRARGAGRRPGRLAPAMLTAWPALFGLWALGRSAVGAHWYIAGALLGAALVAAGLTLWLAPRCGLLPGAAMRDDGHAPALVAALQLAALFTYLHWQEDTLSAIRPGTERVRLLLYCGTWAASLALWLPWTARVRGRAGVIMQTPWRGFWTGVAFGAGLVLIEADRRALVGLYPAAHVWLQVVGLIALDSAVAPHVAAAAGDNRKSRSRRRRWVVGGAVCGAALSVVAALFVVGPGDLGERGFRAAVARAPVGPTLLQLRGGADTGSAWTGPRDHPLLQIERFHDHQWPANELNILLLSIATLSSDVLPIPGGPDVARAPRLTELAGTCADFRRAYSGGPRTSIGMGTLMLGRYSAHLHWDLWFRAEGGRMIDPRTVTLEEIKQLGSRSRTTVPRIPAGGNLAQRLNATGFWTMAIPYGVDGFSKPGHGYDPGFDLYPDMTKRWYAPSSKKIAPAAVSQIAVHRDRRWFQWVHFYDPHESSGRRSRYLELVKKTDEGVGMLLDGLTEHGLRERTAIVVVSDHGGLPGDHRRSFHGTSLYDEEVRVPLLICIPGVRPVRLRQAVSTIDATATMLALAGADLRGIDGVNLLPLITEGRYPPTRPVFTEDHRYRSTAGERTVDQRAVVLGRWKMIWDRIHETLELYDLQADPREHENVVEQNPDVSAQLELLLEVFVRNPEREFPLP